MVATRVNLKEKEEKRFFKDADFGHHLEGCMKRSQGCMKVGQRLRKHVDVVVHCCLQSVNNKNPPTCSTTSLTLDI